MKALIGFVGIVVFVCPLFPQGQPTLLPVACGDSPASMAVSLDSSQHVIEPPDPGKARIYFIQDTGQLITVAYPTTKIGIDGKWVGANKKDSWFSVSVEPGEHHLCAAIQSAFVPNYREMAHLTTEAGKIYYYRTRIIYSQSGPAYLSLLPADSDEAQYLIQQFPLAKAHARK